MKCNDYKRFELILLKKKIINLLRCHKNGKKFYNFQL